MKKTIIILLSIFILGCPTKTNENKNKAKQKVPDEIQKIIDRLTEEQKQGIVKAYLEYVVGPNDARHFLEHEHFKLSPSFEIRIWSDKTLRYGDVVALVDFYDTYEEIVDNKNDALLTIKVSVDRQPNATEKIKDIFKNTGRLLVKALNNNNHFHPLALQEWRRLHDQAIEKAQKAVKEYGKMTEEEVKMKLLEKSESLNDVKKALLINAFADHFLTDAFASGHMRVPIKKLRERYWLPLKGDLHSKIMHDQDNQKGLWVKSNSLPFAWKAYGDGSLHKSTIHENIIIETVKHSTDNIFRTLAGEKADFRRIEDAFPTPLDWRKKHKVKAKFKNGDGTTEIKEVTIKNHRPIFE